ncbi:MAG: hypothetical protein PHV56_01780 [Clostridia bacterium]|nr:hypothetical protein [Clostridia bacterium]
MNIFQMKTKPHSVERFRQFIDEKFVCIGWPGIGNLENASKDDIRNRIEKSYGYTGHKLGNALGHVNAFVNTMKSGDAVFITENEWAYIGTVGDYEYVGIYDNDKDGMCHRRKVEWMNRIKISDLASDIQRLINNRNIISKYPESIEELGIEKYLSKQPPLSKENSIKLDILFRDALTVLEEELKSEDPERRVKAASEILRLKSK